MDATCGINIALHKAAHQSSSDYNGYPEKAVDGVLNAVGPWDYDNPPTHTGEYEENPWWCMGAGHNKSTQALHAKGTAPPLTNPFQLHQHRYVDLGAGANVQAVTIFNRADQCQGRLRWLEIRVGDAVPEPDTPQAPITVNYICTTYQGPPNTVAGEQVRLARTHLKNFHCFPFLCSNPLALISTCPPTGRHHSALRAQRPLSVYSKEGDGCQFRR